MRKFVNSFQESQDVIIIDTTHKSNRFNMALLDVVVIDNLGKTSTCFFALLDNQKYDTFCWALNNLKTQIDVKPLIIFSDDDEALIQGMFQY